MVINTFATSRNQVGRNFAVVVHIIAFVVVGTFAVNRNQVVVDHNQVVVDHNQVNFVQ